MRLLCVALGLAACSGAPAPVPAEVPVEAAVEAVEPPDLSVSNVPEVVPLPEVGPEPASRRVRSPLAVPSSAETRAVRDALAGVVAARGLDPTNAWAIGHALLALGADATLADGTPAVDHLFSTWAERRSVGIGFPSSKGGVPVEPHRDLVLKVLTEVGADPARTVQVQGAEVDLATLYRSSLWSSWVSGATLGFPSWNDTPWALQALAAWSPPDVRWVAKGGRHMTLDLFTHDVVSKLHRETRFMADARAKNTSFLKRGQNIFRFTCGGAHLLQGAAYAVGRGFGEKGDRDRMMEQATLLVWRYDIELGITDDALRKNPEYAVLLLVQRLKFTGHFLESLHKLAALDLLPDEVDGPAVAERALSDVVATVRMIQAAGMFDRLDAVRAEREQTYLDLVGDSAHAVRALDLATGKGTLAL